MRYITFLFEAIPTPPRHLLLYLWNFWPPFLGAGIRITWIAPDLSAVETRMRLRWWNRNYIGILFGGSIYSMCDPFPMVMLMELLGPKYIVRDKSAQIRFLKKSTGEITARMEISTKTVAEIWNCPEDVQERSFLAQVKNEKNEVVAEVTKLLHIRRKSLNSMEEAAK